MQEMWDKLFTIELVNWMDKTTDGAEDLNTVSVFFEYIKKKMDYKQLVVLAVQWGTLSQERQVNLAIHFAGIHHASRFMLLLDFLSDRYKKGKLK